MFAKQQSASFVPPFASSSAESRLQVTWYTLAWVFIAAGIFFRLFHFFQNRSLWIDEIYLATSLIKLDFLQLTSPTLAYEQKAPIGFLWAVRLAVLAFGKSEMALRLFPLLCGLTSLFMFVPVASHFLKPFGVAIALGVLALAPPLVYHSVEVKQYGTSLLATVLSLYLYIRYKDKHDLQSLLLWGIGGGVLLWFSYEVIFVLAGMAFAVCLSYIIKREWKLLFRAFIPFTLWLLSFAVNFLLFTYRHADSEWLVEWFALREAFMPFPPTSLAELSWFGHAAYLLLDYPLGLLRNDISAGNEFLRWLLNLSLLPVVCMAIGFISIYRKDKTMFMLLYFPLALALLASGLKLYPFYERLTVFLAPLLLVTLATGTQWLSARLPLKAPWRFALASLVLLGPLLSSVQQVYNDSLFGGKKHARHREVFLYIQERVHPDDIVYINWNAIPEYQYYKEVYHFSFKALTGADVRPQSASAAEYLQNLGTDIDAMTQHPRAWVVLNTFMGANIGEVEYPGDLFSTTLKDGKLFLKELSSHGRLIDEFKGLHDKAYLFDFTE